MAALPLEGWEGCLETGLSLQGWAGLSSGTQTLCCSLRGSVWIDSQSHLSLLRPLSLSVNSHEIRMKSSLQPLPPPTLTVIISHLLISVYIIISRLFYLSTPPNILPRTSLVAKILSSPHRGTRFDPWKGN